MNDSVIFFISCRDHPHGDELLRILEKRINEGILPEWNYFENKYDYTDKMGYLADFLSEFDELYYPKKLLSDEVSSKIDPIIENFHKSAELLLSLKGDNFDTPDSAFVFLNEAGKLFYQFDMEINSILYESKKDIFVNLLHAELKTISIDSIYEIVKEDNRNNSLYFYLSSLKSYEKIVNCIFWKVYSYEMRFYDTFLEIKNKYRVLFESKFEELQTELEKKFTLFETIHIDDGTVDEININLLRDTYELLKTEKK